MIINETEAKNYLYQAGFRDSALNAAVRIAWCESGTEPGFYNTQAHNTAGEDSRGLMQINVASNANPQYASYDLFNPVINTQVAFKIYNAWGKNFGAWTCAHTLGLVNPENNIGIGIAFLIGALLYSQS
jgi:hypothetical protein